MEHGAKRRAKKGCGELNKKVTCNQTFPTSAFPLPFSKEWLCTHLRAFFGIPGPLCRPGSTHDTDCITYRCFLPDLTRFATVCCVVSDQNGSGSPRIRPLGGSSAPHKADFGKRAPLTPRLAQPVSKIRHK